MKLCDLKLVFILPDQDQLIKKFGSTIRPMACVLPHLFMIKKAIRLQSVKRYS